MTTGDGDGGDGWIEVLRISSEVSFSGIIGSLVEGALSSFTRLICLIFWIGSISFGSSEIIGSPFAVFCFCCFIKDLILMTLSHIYTILPWIYASTQQPNLMYAHSSPINIPFHYICHPRLNISHLHISRPIPYNPHYPTYSYLYIFNGPVPVIPCLEPLWP